MKIYRGYNDFDAVNPVVTIGMFDGVHRGHSSLLQRLAEKAQACKGESVVITFEPHPRIVLSGSDSELRFLTSLQEKIDRLEKIGIDKLIIIPFTPEFSRKSACDFVREILVEAIHTHSLLIGYDHQFGYRGEGSSVSVSQCAAEYNFSLERVDAFKESGVSLSSSVIRDMISTGRLAEANSLLGYDYFLRGTVIEGNRIGRAMGYPTANLKPDYDYKLIPSDGVYAVEVLYEKKVYRSMLYIGTRPTLQENNPRRSIEANLFDYSGNMYGKEITIFFRYRIRDDKKFSNKEMLRKQIAKDKEITLSLLK